MFVQYWVSTFRWIKDTNTEVFFQDSKNKRQTYNRCCKKLNPCSCVDPPYKEWHFEKCHTWCSKSVNRYKEVKSCKDRCHTKNKCCNKSVNNICIRCQRIWCIKSPTCICKTITYP